MKRPTTSDIAQLANVSQSTVSKILSDDTTASFSEDTKQRVKEAASKLGYKIRIRKKRTSSSIVDLPVIGIICPTPINPYYTITVQAIEQIAYQSGYRVIVCNTYRDLLLEESYLDLLENMKVSGIIYCFLPIAREKAEKTSKNVPVVVIGDKSDNTELDIIELDSQKSGVILTEYLLGLGHKSIAFISTSLNFDNPPRMRRLVGVTEAMKKHGLEQNLFVYSKNISLSNEMNYTSNEYDTGYSLTLKALEEHDVTAFIGVNDMVSYGILDALSSKSYKVPEDYSVCGFDDNFPSSFRTIGLTTVDHYMVYKGNNAFNILLKKIQTKEKSWSGDDRTVKVVYTPNLIVRSSTGKPPEK